MLYTSNPEKVAQRDLDAAHTARDATAKRLGVAQDKVTECEATLQRLAREGVGDPALVNAEIALDTAERRVSTLQPALAEADKLVALLESQLAETLDKKARAATAAECDALAVDLEAVGKEIVPPMTRLAALGERATKFCLDAGGLTSYAALSRTQIPDAISAISAMLHAHAVGLTAAPVVAPEQNVKLFCLKPVWWMADGRQNKARRFTDADIPAAFVARALSSGGCCRLDDPRRKANFGADTVGDPDLKSCVDLNAAGPAPAAAAAQRQPCREQSSESGMDGRCMRCGATQAEVCPQRVPHSAAEPNDRLFTVVDRGAPFQMKVAR
jgi:hypothetical protein